MKKGKFSFFTIWKEPNVTGRQASSCGSYVRVDFMAGNETNETQNVQLELMN